LSPKFLIGEWETSSFATGFPFTPVCPTAQAGGNDVFTQDSGFKKVAENEIKRRKKK
jgi:hypothetical protein